MTKRTNHPGPRMSRSAMARTFAVIASILMMLGMSAVAQDAAKNGPASTPESTVRIDGEAELDASVGMNASIRSVFLDGTELEVKKVDPRTAAVRLRIDQSYPHGDGFRYDLTWMAMEPGPHNLIDYLSRKDGSDVTSLPPITVTAQSVLPSDRVLPNALSKSPLISAGGYRTTLLVGSVVWLVGLGFLLRWWWQDRPKLGHVAAESSQTRLQQLEALLLQASRHPDTLSPAAKAQLESEIVAFWRDEKQLTSLTPEAALAALKKDEEVGPLLKTLEQWLYDRPERRRFDADALLAPFRALAQRHIEASLPDVTSVPGEPQRLTIPAGAASHE